jgi:hypothetical protein
LIGVNQTSHLLCRSREFALSISNLHETFNSLFALEGAGLLLIDGSIDYLAINGRELSKLIEINLNILSFLKKVTN